MVYGQSSSAEMISEWSKGAKVVKAFNITGSDNMADPVYGDQPLTMFICGDDAKAKEQVTSLAGDLGFETMDVGKLETARYLESLGGLWIHLVYDQGMGKKIGFKLLKR